MTSAPTDTARKTAERKKRQDRLDEYVEWIRARCETEPGVRSALRRGLRRTPEHAVTMHRYVAPWTEQVDPSDEWAYYTVAALIAAQPPATRRRASDESEAGDDPAGRPATTSDEENGSRSPRPNLGETLARIGGDSDRADSTERRLHLLVRQGVPGIQRHLPGVIRHLAAERVTPDWGFLLRDLLRWRRFRADVSREWLQAYYRARFREDKAAGSAGSEPPNDPSGE